MSLSCECDGEWSGGWWVHKIVESTLQTIKRRRCKSCKEPIDIGATVLEFKRVHLPETETEIKIYGEEYEINMASWFMCEQCGDLFAALEELGYCISLTANMHELVAEYADMKQQEKINEKSNPDKIL